MEDTVLVTLWSLSCGQSSKVIHCPGTTSPKRPISILPTFSPPMLMSKKTFLVTTGPCASTLELQLEMMTKRAANTPVNPMTFMTLIVVLFVMPIIGIRKQHPIQLPDEVGSKSEVKECHQFNQCSPH